MNLTLKRTPGLFLVGFMGSGKTTVGRLLARELGWQFADTDADIEADQGKTIPRIFDEQGEEYFRQVEHEMIRRRVVKIKMGQPMIVSLGGGAFTREENVALIRGNGVSVWLDCAWDVICHRVGQSSHRPLARDPERMAELFAARHPFYEQADFHIKVTQDDSQQAFRDILALPVFQ